MNRVIRAAAAALLVVAGCVGPRVPSTLPQDARPEPAQGYVAAGFTARDLATMGYGLVLLDDAQVEHYLWSEASSAAERRQAVDSGDVRKLTDGPQGAPPLATAPAMIALPPGDYRVAFWVAYHPFSKEIVKKMAVEPGNLLSTRFTLRPGEVVMLGQWLGTFSADTEIQGFKKIIHYHYGLAPQPITRAQGLSLLREGFPAFAALPVHALTWKEQAQGRADLAFQRGADPIVLEAVVNGQPGRFAVDREVKAVLLDPRFARKLGDSLLQTSSRTVQGKRGPVSFRGASLGELKVGEASVIGLHALVMEDLPLGLDGVLGEPFLALFDVRLDRAGGRLELSAKAP